MNLCLSVPGSYLVRGIFMHFVCFVCIFGTQSMVELICLGSAGFEIKYVVFWMIVQRINTFPLDCWVELLYKEIIDSIIE